MGQIIKMLSEDQWIYLLQAKFEPASMHKADQVTCYLLISSIIYST